MFHMTENMPNLLESFYLPFGGKLNPENRWVKLAALIPWDKVERKYVKAFKSSNRGEEALPVRVALGSLIIKERLGLSDRETTQQIMENPYLQFFIGFTAFKDDEPPFHHSLMTHFRERLGAEILMEINEWIIAEAAETRMTETEMTDDDDDDDDDDGQLSFHVGEELSVPQESPAKSNPKQPTSDSASSSDSKSASRMTESTNRGHLIIDATCAPADIRYPTDLGLLNHAREILEDIIDTLHEPYIGIRRKPRTYRNQARKAYLSVSKQRKAGKNKIRKAVRKQLSYVRRDLSIVERQIADTSLAPLSRKQYRRLLVISELYRQQREMFNGKKHAIEDRIVSIDQPHVRPMVRGKAGSQVEFGAKIAASVVDGFARIEHMQWDNFNESKTLQDSVESYKERYGRYPEAILADKLYRNRENLRYCKELGIRLSGPRLGRPPKDEQKSEDQKQGRIDASERNQIEGKFGEGKRKFGLGRIRARLANTSQTVIALQFLVMNLERRLRILFCLIVRWQTCIRNMSWVS